MIKKRYIFIPLAVLMIGVLVIGVVGYVLLSRKGSDTVAMSGATPVGLPNGPATKMSIGSAGGSIASPDGRIVVDVPPNALPGPLDFSVQPITNLASGGLGNAYRLEPGGHIFATPVKISLKLEDQDLTASPAIAYQDPTGVWQAFKTANIDQAGKTISVSTTHFTDFAGVSYKLTPEKATVKVGESIHIKLVGCRKEDSLLNTIQELFTTPHLECSLTTAQNPVWSADFGTVAPDGVGVLYTAPAKKPPYGNAEVVLKFNFGTFVGREVAKIKIVEPGYAASGSAGTTVVSGDICDLDTKFSLKTNNPFVPTFEFTPSGPSSPNTGTFNFTTGNGLSGSCTSCKYTVIGTDTLKTGIEVTGGSTGMLLGVTKSGGGSMQIKLVPLERECRQ